MKHVWYKLKWYINDVVTFLGENKNSNADKSMFQKKREKKFLDMNERKKFHNFYEKILTSDLGINFNNFTEI
jgi:hypothetical protein